MSMFDCTHCGDKHHVNDFCATGPMSAEPVAPTTRETADHAELLAKLANDMRKFEHHAVGSLRIDMDEVRKIIAACDGHSALLSEIAALRGERDRLRTAVSKSNDEICQSLGKALGYPWFKDDQANFPGSTETDGVCVGDHVAESIADEASRRLTQAERQRDELRKAMPDISSVIAWLDNGCEPKHAVTELSIYKARIDQALANQGADQ